MKQEHGIQIETFVSSDKTTSCLLVRPNSIAGAGERGEKIREQLRERGVRVGEFGEENKLIVLLHGRRGRKEDLLAVAKRFCAAGFVCVMPDLPANGDSPVMKVKFGLGEDERLLPGRVAADVRARLGRSNMPTSLWGMSMGGIVCDTGGCG